MKIGHILILAVALMFPLTTSAYDGITYYGAHMSSNDHYNSSGKRLNKLRDILQQDRANVHKFGLIDRDDEIDGYFTSLRKRQLFQRASISISRSLRRKIVNQSNTRVTVFVFDDYTIEVTEGLPQL